LTTAEGGAIEKVVETVVNAVADTVV